MGYIEDERPAFDARLETMGQRPPNASIRAPNATTLSARRSRPSVRDAVATCWRVSCPFRSVSIAWRGRPRDGGSAVIFGVFALPGIGHASSQLDRIALQPHLPMRLEQDTREKFPFVFKCA